MRYCRFVILGMAMMSVYIQQVRLFLKTCNYVILSALDIPDHSHQKMKVSTYRKLWYLLIKNSTSSLTSF